VKLEVLNAFAQLIAAIGVIASLFYLAAQIRQNTRSQRSVVVDSLAASLIHLLGPQGYEFRLAALGLALPPGPGEPDGPGVPTVSVPIICAGWNMQWKKYAPGGGAAKL